MILNALRSLRWADFFLHALLDPPALYRAIKRNDPRALGLSFVLPVLLAMVHILVAALLSEQTRFFYSKLSYGWILNIMLITAGVVITAALMDLLIQFMGHAGHVRETISLLNYALFPQLFIMPVVYIFRTLSFAPVFFYALSSFAFILWSSYIAVRGFMEMHEIGAGRAVVVFLFPFVLAGVVLFFILLLAALLLWGYICG